MAFNIAQAQNSTTVQKVVVKPVIVTAVPAPKETIVTPEGYI